MTLNNKWQCMWEVCTRVLDSMQKVIKALKEVFSKIAEIFRKAFAFITEDFEDFLEEVKPTSYKLRSNRRYYDYKPQLKVNTKGYAPCCLPVTRRYI